MRLFRELRATHGRGLVENRATRRATNSVPEATILDALRCLVLLDRRLTVDRKWWALGYLEGLAR